MGVGGQRHTPAASPPGKRPGIHCIGDWVGPRAALDGCGKSCPYWDSIPRLSSSWRVAVPTLAVLAHEQLVDIYRNVRFALMLTYVQFMIMLIEYSKC
jgi:hypothetical protein